MDIRLVAVPATTAILKWLAFCWMKALTCLQYLVD